MGIANETIHNDVSSLCDNLEQKLSERLAMWNKWAESDKKRCEQVFAAEQSKLRTAQEQIDNTSHDILTTQMQTDLGLDNDSFDLNESSTSSADGESVASPRNMDNKPSIMTEELEKLNDHLRQQQSRKQELEDLVVKKKGRAQESCDLRNQVQDSATTTIFHLTKAKEHYDWLGLHYEKAGADGEVRCVFSQIDPLDPERPFSCTLAINSQTDLFGVQDCDPPHVIPQDTLEWVSKQMNEQDAQAALNFFVRSMRRAFQTHLEETRTPTRS